MNKEQLKKWIDNNYYRNDGYPNANLSRESYCKKLGDKALDFHNSVFELTSFLDHLNPKFSNRVYCILNDVDSAPTCKMCDNPVTLFWKPSSTQMFNTYCCVKCSRSDPENDAKRRKTNLKVHGIENPIHKVKTKRTLTFNIVVERAKKHYGDRFEYIDISFDNDYKYSVYCKKHEYNFTPILKDLMNGKTNCRYCRSENMVKSQTHSQKKVESEVYKVKGESITLKGKYKGMHIEALFECKEHGEFYKKPYQILQDQNCPYCYSGTSKEEQSLVDYITSIVPKDKMVLTNNRKLLGDGKEIDVFVGNVMIEYNGLYWHSDIFHNKNYHLEKTKKANERGCQLFHIWSNEWKDENTQNIWKSILSNAFKNNQHKIHARKCNIVSLDNDEYRLFLDNNHLQGYSSASIKYGLIYDNEIVSVMSFAKPRFSHKYDYEMVRYCSKQFTNVVGGASKLFSHFVKNYLQDGETIVSYSDKRISKGNLYKQLKFNYSHTSSPNYVYTKDWVRLLNRMQCQKHKLGNILGDNYDPNLSESENMKNNGYYRIYDCGNDVWEFTKLQSSLS